MAQPGPEQSMAVRPQIDTPDQVDPTKWVDQYGDALLGYAAARVGPREVAEDLVQETLLAAWKARQSYDGRSSMKTWLIAILRRKIADHYRQSGRAPMSTERSAQEAGADLFDTRGKWLHSPAKWSRPPDQIAEDAEFRSVLTKCITLLPVHLAQAFHDREIALASTEKICAVAGISPKNLAVRLHRARLLLRQCLERDWFGRTEGRR